jgi:hypothetical protein
LESGNSLEAAKNYEACLKGQFADDLDIKLRASRAFVECGRSAEAKAEFEAAIEQSDSFELKAEYAIWAAEFGDTATAARLKHELEQMTKRWSKHTHELNRPLTRRLDAAFSKR